MTNTLTADPNGDVAPVPNPSTANNEAQVDTLNPFGQDGANSGVNSLGYRTDEKGYPLPLVNLSQRNVRRPTEPLEEPVFSMQQINRMTPEEAAQHGLEPNPDYSGQFSGGFAYLPPNAIRKR